ncbi:hypothetical protein [Massilia cavernae]|nr:hypothetical protein [Massilia cavernae]
MAFITHIDNPLQPGHRMPPHPSFFLGEGMTPPPRASNQPR